MSQHTFAIKGVTPLLMSRDYQMEVTDDEQKAEGKKRETLLEKEQRIWKNKAHQDESGNIFLPVQWPFYSIIESQSLTGCPIKPKGASRKNATCRDAFTQALLFTGTAFNKRNAGLEGVPLMNGKAAYNIDKATPYGTTVHRAKGKQTTSLPCVRPQFPCPWSAEFTFEMNDDICELDHVVEAMQWIGLRWGFGAFNRRHKGNFGLFEVTAVDGKAVK